MLIEYFGHSCFRITDSKGFSIITDPYPEDVGFSMPHIKGNLVTISHEHYDHNDTSKIEGRCSIARKPGKYLVDGHEVLGIKCYHDPVQGRQRGESIAFKYLLDGVVVCHLGDLGERFDMDVVRRIGKADIIFIPVGGTFTIDGKEAKQYVDAIGAKIIIPMHYRTPGCTLGISDVNGFLSQFSNKKYELDSVGGEYTVPDLATIEKPTIVVMQRLTRV